MFIHLIRNSCIFSECSICWRCGIFKFIRDGGDYEPIVRSIYRRLGLEVPEPGCPAAVAADQDYDIFFSLFVQELGLQQKFQVDSVQEWACNSCSVLNFNFSAEEYFFCFAPFSSIEDSFAAPRDILFNKTCVCRSEVKGMSRVIQSRKYLWVRVFR